MNKYEIMEERMNKEWDERLNAFNNGEKISDDLLLNMDATHFFEIDNIITSVEGRDNYLKELLTRGPSCSPLLMFKGIKISVDDSVDGLTYKFLKEGKVIVTIINIGDNKWKNINHAEQMEKQNEITTI